MTHFPSWGQNAERPYLPEAESLLATVQKRIGSHLYDVHPAFHAEDCRGCRGKMLRRAHGALGSLLEESAAGGQSIVRGTQVDMEGSEDWIPAQSGSELEPCDTCGFTEEYLPGGGGEFTYTDPPNMLPAAGVRNEMHCWLENREMRHLSICSKCYSFYFMFKQDRLPAPRRYSALVMAGVVGGTIAMMIFG